jgi:uncharacterized membrane protein HdeD (DUF308 family)
MPLALAVDRTACGVGTDRMRHSAGSDIRTDLRRLTVILLGVVLLIIGFVASVQIIWTLGIIAIVVGAILAILGMGGREIAGRRHWY